MISLCGANGTGKSTLAALYARANQLEFVQTSTSAVMQRLGLDARKDYDFTTRLAAQHVILDELVRSYHSATRMFITDRSPLDALVYTMADVRREMSEADSAAFMEYRQRCFDITNRYFQVVVLIQPGIQVAEDRGADKGPGHAAYIEHFNTLAMGIIQNPDSLLNIGRFYLPRPILDLHDRLAALEGVAKKTIVPLMADHILNPLSTH